MDLLSYFFTPHPGSACKYYLPLIILSALLIIGSIAFSIHYKKRKKTDFAFKRLFKKMSSRFLTIGILILVLLVVRYENIPYFSMRIWLYVLLIILALFAYKYIKTYKVKYPKEKLNTKPKFEKKEKSKRVYLPNKKRKGKK